MSMQGKLKIRVRTDSPHPSNKKWSGRMPWPADYFKKDIVGIFQSSLSGGTVRIHGTKWNSFTRQYEGQRRVN